MNLSLITLPIMSNLYKLWLWPTITRFSFKTEPPILPIFLWTFMDFSTLIVATITRKRTSGYTTIAPTTLGHSQCQWEAFCSEKEGQWSALFCQGTRGRKKWKKKRKEEKKRKKKKEKRSKKRDFLSFPSFLSLISISIFSLYFLSLKFLSLD